MNGLRSEVAMVTGALRASLGQILSTAAEVHGSNLFGIQGSLRYIVKPVQLTFHICHYHTTTQPGPLILVAAVAADVTRKW